MSTHRFFVTGATGFIGSHVVSKLLNTGHQVRVSIRKEVQIDDLKARFPSHASQLEFVVIADLTDADSVHAALKDVHYVFHLASPMPGKGSDFKKDYFEPAVLGTEVILRSASLVSTVRRVVIVSSILALMPLGSLTQPGFVIQENTSSDVKVDPNMDFPDGVAGHSLKYQASKILAHQATLAWMAKENPHFTLITLHPTFVVGHDLTQTDATPRGVNGWVMKSLTSEHPIIPSSLVDVRDVAEAHLRAVDCEVTDPVTEIILGGESFLWKDVVDFVHTRYPEFPLKLVGPFTPPFVSEGERAWKVLGLAL